MFIRTIEVLSCSFYFAAFWQYVREHLTKHEVQRFNTLKQINTDMGRGRAWLRACLNEHSLERYMHMLIEKEDIVRYVWFCFVLVLHNFVCINLFISLGSKNCNLSLFLVPANSLGYETQS
jgi:hypothetical protein